MIKCFVCSFNFENPQKLCEHLKIIHRISGQNLYECTICQLQLTEMWKYRRHLDICYVNDPIASESVEQEQEQDYGQNGLLNFETKIHKLALEMTCKLAGNMSVPRNYVFELMQEFRSFFDTMLTEGLTEYVKPYICNEQQNNMEYLLQIFKDPFKRVNTENRLDGILKTENLISPLIIDDLHKSSDSHKKPDSSKKERVTVMPLEFQFKKFFELKNVFQRTQDYAKNVSDRNLGHFINGKLWKKKLKSFSNGEIVIPYHLHTDDVQTNNALGAHRAVGLETCTYYSFPTVPPEYNSRLQNIFVAQIFSSNASKNFGNFSCFKTMINQLNKFAQDGITLNIDGNERKVHFVLGLTLGDNKGVNDMCGFARSHKANYFCRFCKMHRRETKTSTVQNDKMMRNVKNYVKDLAENEFKNTGIQEESIINSIHLCHATDSIGADTMHDILEGILHYNMCEIILYFISEGFFTLDQLNQLKFDLAYGEIESNNKSPPVTKKRLKAKKLLMSASEMDTFARHFVFIVGDLIPKDDEVWKFYLQTMKFMELMELTTYTENDLKDLTKAISKMNRMYMTLFETTLKPKHHIITHYPTLIRLFGPLRCLSSMRFEAKHRFVKNYTKNTVSRIDLSYSLGRKLQYNFASFVLNNTGLQDYVTMAKSKFIQLENSSTFGNIEKSGGLKEILVKNLKETKKVTINGVTFSTKLSIIVEENSKFVLMRIMKIVFDADNISDIFLICKEHKDVVYNTNYGCHEVNITDSGNDLKLISASAALNELKYPVSLHVMDDNIHRFRIKSF